MFGRIKKTLADMYWSYKGEIYPLKHGLTPELRKAIILEGVRDMVLINLNNHMDRVIKKQIQNPEAEKEDHFMGHFEILEHLIEIDGRPAVQAVLARYLEQIAANRDALSLMLSASEMYPDDMGTYYLRYCTEQRRFNEMIAFHEKHSVEWDDNENRLLGDAYIRSARGVGIEKRLRRIKEGPDPECHELLEKACKILFKPAGFSLKVLEKGGGTIDVNCIGSINDYAYSLIQRAHFIESDANLPEDQPDPCSLRNEAAYASLLITRLLSSFSSEELGSCEEQLHTAHINTVASHTSLAFSADETEKAIEYANDLKKSTIVQKHPHFDYLLGNLAKLQEIKHQKIEGEFPTSIEDQEDIYLLAIENNWTELQHYYDYADFLQSVDKEERSKYILMFSHLSILLNHLIKLNKYKIKPPPMTFGMSDFTEHEPSGEDYKKYFDDLDEAVRKEMVPLTLHFKPLRDALESYRQRFEVYLEGVLHDLDLLPSDRDEREKWLKERVKSRVKEPYSIFLKMLRRNKRDFSELDDWVGFSVFPETLEECDRLYKRVEADFFEVKRCRNWLYNPRSRNFRSSQIIGLLREGDATPVEFQTRPKFIEDEVQAGYAHHNVMKVDSGDELEKWANANPWLFLQKLHEIVSKVSVAYRKIMEADTPIKPEEALRLYYNIPNVYDKDLSFYSK